MTQPVIPGARAACFDENGSEHTESDTGAPACLLAQAVAGTATATRAEPSSFTPQHVPFGLRYCREADSIVEGFLCSEPLVVSNACRRSHNPVEQFVCDDLKMQALQKSILEQTWSLVRSLLLDLLRR